MKKAIAMRCTQEQWNEIKDKLVGIELVDDNFNLTKFPYLLNNYSNLRKVGIGSLSLDLIFGHVTYEIWNEQIFLEACGIEVEEVEYQYKSLGGDWFDYTGGYEFRVKPKPTYKKEIENIEALAKEIGYKVILEKL